MQPDAKRLAELEAKWLNGTITAEEAKEYARWYNEGQDEPVHVPESMYTSKEEHKAALWKKIEEGRKIKTKKFRIIYLKYASVAAALLLFVAAFWLYNGRLHNSSSLAGNHSQPTLTSPIVPGTTRATLVLDDGRQIVLDTASSGLLAVEGNASVNNLNGELVYADVNAASAVMYNTLKTNRGEQFPITLSDGTKIWLNAASSLRFPVSFVEKERRVEVTGEAYFEVAKNAAKPFIVTVNNMHVRVLGTHFNINAYPEKQMVKTTLLEGSIKINEQAVLKPGQQSFFNHKNSTLKIIDDADLEEVMAWKNGIFQFRNASIQDLMESIEKWYDIEIAYSEPVSTDRFSGKINRNATLQEVLQIFKDSKIHFKLEGRKLTVMP